MFLRTLATMADERQPLDVDDGLFLPVVGSWASDKHSKIGYYASLFSASMKNKWDCRVFIDLFAGAGKAKIKGSGDIVPGSPLVALDVQEPFDHYVFCELNEDSADALEKRVANHFPERNAKVLNTDSNEHVDQVLNLLPAFGPSYKGLTFCFVDPYTTKNLHFSTLRKISSSIYVDFVVLIPSFMDIRRNEHNYTKPTCSILDDFLGTDRWRAEWASGQSPIRDFGVFVADCFGRQMAALDYHYDGPEDFETVRQAEDRRLHLYHLGFFSRNKLGVKFWKETRKRTGIQKTFGF